VDINLGCPAPSLKREGAATALAKDVSRVEEILTVARKATGLPLSAKIRLGQETNPKKIMDFCFMLEDSGVDYLFIHARFDGEKFCRKPKWRLIALISTRLNVPVLANGEHFYC